MGDQVVYSKRTVASLAMLLFALALGAGAYLLVNVNQFDGVLPGDWTVAVGLWFGLGLVSWIVVRVRLPYADPLLLPSVFLLNGLGIAMIYRLDQATDPPMQSGRLQLMWTIAAVAVMIAVVLFLGDHRRLQRYTYLWFALGLGLLLLPLLPGIGYESHGARVWIRFGSFSFQPGEVAKIVLSVAFASYLTEKRDVLAVAGRRILGIDLPRARDLGPIALIFGVSLIILVFQTDLGMSLLFFSLFVAMIYVATQRPSWVILGLLLVIALGTFGYSQMGHVRVRFESWLNPFANPDQNGQIISAQYGFASGGLFGTGWGLGRPYLTPIAKSDFIAAALGEELGLVGLFAILLVYLVFVTRILRAALAAREPFGKLLAAGLGFVFALQVVIIVGGVTRLLPLTGLTTPFMSQGGSSLISNYLLLGLLLTLTHQVRRPQPAVSPDEYAVGAAAAGVPSVAAPLPPPAPAGPGKRPGVPADDEPTEVIVAVRPEDGPPTEPFVPLDQPPPSVWSRLPRKGEDRP